MQATAAPLTEMSCRLGEGIGVDPLTASLRWFDITGCAKIEYDLVTKMAKRIPLPEMPSAGAAVDLATEMIFMQTGLWLRQRDGGRLERLAAIEADRPDLRSNDGRTHPSGAFWCSTMALDKTDGAGSIYWFREGELRRLYEGLTVGNAISFTEDGCRAYFSDTPKGTIWRVATDPSTGLPRGDPVVFHQAPAEDPSGPDGAVVDRDGRLYSARWGGARVDVFSPAGRRIGVIATGGLNTTCPAFWGPNLSGLAITSATDEMSEAELAAHPQSGRTFFVEPGALGFACRGKLDPPVRL